MRNEKGQFVKGCKRPDITGKKNGLWTGGLPSCVVCDKKLHSYGAKFCIFHRSAGQNNGRWKGGKETKKIRAIAVQHARVTRQKGNGGSYTVQEWLDLVKKFDYMCLCCKRKEPEIKLTADHILPISLGGTSFISNIQPLCKSCNSRKFTKYINYISQYYELKETTI